VSVVLTRVGRDGPCMSASNIPTFLLNKFAIVNAMLQAIVLLPTPPLHEYTAIICLTLSMFFLCI